MEIKIIINSAGANLHGYEDRTRIIIFLIC